MFTLNLKEIELTPRIEEDKSFSNENLFKLETEAVEYILEKYDGVYKNPITISRKINDAIRDDKGETPSERVEREQSERREHDESSNKVREDIKKEVTAKYDPEFEKMHEETDKKIRTLYDEYRPKIEVLENEGKKDEIKALEEERNQKEDDMRHEDWQKRDALSNKRLEEIEEKVKATTGQ